MSHKSKIFTLLTTILIIGAQNVWAKDSSITKLSRGIENIITSPVEFPIEYIELNHQKKSVVEVITAGTVYGLFKTTQRLFMGTVETLTFIFPFPNEDYEPLLQPATPLIEAREQATRIAAEKKSA